MSTETKAGKIEVPPKEGKGPIMESKEKFDASKASPISDELKEALMKQSNYNEIIKKLKEQNSQLSESNKSIFYMLVQTIEKIEDIQDEAAKFETYIRDIKQDIKKVFKEAMNPPPPPKEEQQLGNVAEHTFKLDKDLPYDRTKNANT